ncbi:N-acetyltransferase [Palleronia sp. LCG004]|uniref:GNAT family N-acetyltransferase n=1 Tax=Palleronia sp. LCG004 TaxID=3079304 RepID=UPI0029425E0C|nr:N-acetyltransferase [Palleronia sp. LCG004]WOI58371.1 N-acetyltransferase [Palleronia sp. LCG004]
MCRNHRTPRSRQGRSTMKIATGAEGREEALIDLFAAAFTASEGVEEGTLVGGLVRDLLTKTPASDIHVFRAEEDGDVIGAAVFTRLTYPEDPRNVVLLSPMAVAPAHQRRGVGKTLLAHALEALRSEGAEVAITYGDPDYYERVGFAPIVEDQARAPLPLSHPHGWVGQSLTGRQMPVLCGVPSCVVALNRADIW